MRPFLVSLPSGVRYWTVLDDELAVVAEADAFLRHLRLGRDGAELTTRSYAGSVALFLGWCAGSGRSWHVGVEQLGLFILWLRHGGPVEAGAAVVVAGPGARVVRGPRRVNAVLTGVRGFVVHAVTSGSAPERLLSVIYELASDRDLPEQARGEDSALAWRMRARHRLHEPDAGVDRASDEEVVALVAACRSARDRLMVLLMARAGLRRGELCGLRRSDVHLLAGSQVLGCGVPRSHLHVQRREASNGAWAKSRRGRVVPLDSLVVQAFDGYAFERQGVAEAADSDFLMVNLFRPPLGGPMPPGAVNALVGAAGRRAGLRRRITPHQLRHAFGSNLEVSGIATDASFDGFGDSVAAGVSRSWVSATVCLRGGRHAA